MSTFSLSCTSNCAFHSFGSQSTVRSLAAVVIPAQPVFSQIVGCQVSTAYSFGVQSVYTSSQSLAKNNNRHYHITTTATFSTGSQGPT